MIPRLLIVVDTDPRKSARPAEAVRIAAGIAAWKKAEVGLYLRGPGVLALSEFTDELLEEDNYTRYLPILGEHLSRMLVQAGAVELRAVGQPSLPLQEVNERELAQLAGRCQCILRF